MIPEILDVETKKVENKASITAKIVLNLDISHRNVVYSALDLYNDPGACPIPLYKMTTVLFNDDLVVMFSNLYKKLSKDSLLNLIIAVCYNLIDDKKWTISTFPQITLMSETGRFMVDYEHVSSVRWSELCEMLSHPFNWTILYELIKRYNLYCAVFSCKCSDLLVYNTSIRNIRQEQNDREPNSQLPVFILHDNVILYNLLTF